MLMLAIVTVAATLAITSWFQRPCVTLDGAARLLAQDLEDVQDRAAYQRRALRLSFFPDGDGYEVLDAAGRPITAPIGGGEFRRRYSENAVFRGVRVEQTQVGPQGAIHFGPYGLALEGGRVVLSFGDEYRVLRIAPTSGLVTIEEK